MADNYILLSHILNQDIPSYGCRDKFVIRTNSAIAAGETVNSSCWIFTNNHIGTHIDVPRHFSLHGKRVCEYSIDSWFFKKISLVDIPCTGGELISEDMFKDKDIKKNTDLLLIKTGFESNRKENSYWNNNPGLASSLADYLRANYPKIRCVGFDFISLTSWQHRNEGRLAHKNFLCPDNDQREILIIEDMSLKFINNEIKEIVVAPIMVEDGNGAAVTVFGIKSIYTH